MKVTTEELERCETLLTVEIEPAQQEKMLKKAAQRISREVKIPGFRPGKAPYNVIVRRFGVEALQSEALEQSVEDLIKESMAEADITPYAQIQLDGVEWEPALTIKLRVPTKPVVELGDYREVRLEPKAIEVTDQDVEDALKRMQEQNATWAPVERPAELGDLISMTVTEKDGDTVLTERQAVEYELKPVEAEAEDEDDADEIEDAEDDVDEVEAEDDVDETEDDVEAETEPQRSSGPDLTTPLLGLSAGESKTFSLTYPEDFNNEQYAGKEITFEVEVSGVKVKELDPLDDDFAQQMGDYETLDALKDSVREDIRRNRERVNDYELGTQVLDQVIENAEKIDWPQAMEDEQVDHELEHYEYHLKQAGLTLDAALRVQKKTKEDLREEQRGNVVQQLKRGLVMAKLAELEKLEVSQMEVLEQVKLMADMYGGGDRMWQSLLAAESRQNTISNDILSNKVIHRLAAIAKGEAPEPGAEPAVEVEAASEPVSPAAEAESPEAADVSAEVEATEPAASEAPADSDAAAAEAAPASAESDESEAEAEDETTEPITSKA